MGCRKNSHLKKFKNASSGMELERRTCKKTDKMDDIVFEVVDETIRHVFKEAGTKVIYNYLENNLHLKREEIAKRPQAFSADLKKLLRSGAPVIEKMILENLYSKLRMEYTVKEGYLFSDYIKELRHSKLTGNRT